MYATHRNKPIGSALEVHTGWWINYASCTFKYILISTAIYIWLDCYYSIWTSQSQHLYIMYQAKSCPSVSSLGSVAHLDRTRNVLFCLLQHMTAYCLITYSAYLPHYRTCFSTCPASILPGPPAISLQRCGAMALPGYTDRVRSFSVKQRDP